MHVHVGLYDNSKCYLTNGYNVAENMERSHPDDCSAIQLNCGGERKLYGKENVWSATSVVLREITLKKIEIV